MKANYDAWNIPKVDFALLSPNEKLHHILKYAVLAPSAHNTQPWAFTLSTQSNTIKVSVDTSRLLGESDPHMRQTYLGIGAIIENIHIATKAFGGSASVHYDLSDQSVATIIINWPNRFIAPDNMVLNSIQRRTSNRSTYRQENLQTDTLSVNEVDFPDTSLSAIVDPEVREIIGQLTAQADLSLMSKEFKYELASWVHHNWTTRHTGMPAGVQGIPGPISLIAKHILRNAPIEKDQAKKDAKHIGDGPLLIVIAGKNDDKKSWIEAGRMLERVWLDATTKDLDVAPLASIIESGKECRALQNLLKIPYHPLALLRVGHATKRMPRSPRLPEESVTKGR